MKKLIEINSKYLKNKQVIISNNRLLKKIVGVLNKDRFLILSGISGVGKSNIIKDLIFKTKLDKSFFYFNKDLDTNNVIKSGDDLNNMINDNSIKNTKIVILENINKVENIKDFIKDIYSNKKIKLIIIGNNIKISKIEEIEIKPRSIKDLSKIEYSLGNVLKYGLIDDVLIINDKVRNNYLNMLKDQIVFKDIITTFGLKNIELFNYTLSYISNSNIFISAREIHKEVTGNGVKISLVTLLDYINYITRSKLVNKITKFDLKFNRELPSKVKYYFVDIGIRNILNNYSLSKMELIENLIFNELLLRGYKIYCGVNGRFEFSFLIKLERIDFYIHITKNKDINEIKKEAQKLNKIGNNFPKYLIVDDIDSLGFNKDIYEGVKILEVEDLFKEIVFN